MRLCGDSLKTQLEEIFKMKGANSSTYKVIFVYSIEAIPNSSGALEMSK